MYTNIAGGAKAGICFLNGVAYLTWSKRTGISVPVRCNSEEFNPAGNCNQEKQEQWARRLSALFSTYLFDEMENFFSKKQFYDNEPRLGFLDKCFWCLTFHY